MYLNIILGPSWSCSHGVGFFPISVQSVPIPANVINSNPVHSRVYSIHYVIKFVGDLRQIGGFLRVLRLPPPIFI